ncbi:unnamed protein product [Prorocentrum cordatum]|uniref:Uncharacterized protein n=1 Tax=Prorocentrum cordatum TaxID=2364126 RepID=A0ABN9RGD7_9DINO|nr:unnamed protein product [Polarella glacialis]
MLFNPLRRRTIAPQRSRRSSHAPCLPLENELLGRAREPPPSGGAAHVGRRGLSSAYRRELLLSVSRRRGGPGDSPCPAGGQRAAPLREAGSKEKLGTLMPGDTWNWLAGCADKKPRQIQRSDFCSSGGSTTGGALWKRIGHQADAGRGEEGEKEQELRSERAAFARERHGCTAKPKAAWRSDTLSQSYRPRGPHCQAAPRPGRAAPRPAVGQPKHRGPIAPVSLPLIWARRANQRSPPHHSEQRGARRSTLTREGRLQEASTKCPGNEPAQRQLSGPRSGLPAARQPSQRSDSFPRPTATSVVDLCQTRMMS